MKIPIFTSQLEKSREAVDLANIRAAYAEASAEAVSGSTSTTSTNSNVTITPGTGETSYAVVTDEAQSTGAFDKVDDNITWATLPTSVTKGTAFTVTVTVTDAGAVSATITQ